MLVAVVRLLAVVPDGLDKLKTKEGLHFFSRKGNMSGEETPTLELESCSHPLLAPLPKPG